MATYSMLDDLPPAPPGRSGWPWTEGSPPATTMQHGRPWPRITIVTPSFNQALFLEETIRSVLLQGYPNLEYFIMDGGSTDGSLDILRRYEPWLSYLRVGPDGGQSAAIADALERAQGEILAWMNSDDRYLPGAVARAAIFFAQHPNCIFGNGDVNVVDSDGKLLQRIYATGPNRFLTANLGTHCWPQQGCFWRRSAYQKCGGVNRSLEFCMDRDLFLRLLSVGPGARIPGPPLADFRVHDSAKSSKLLDVAQREHSLLLSRYASPSLRPFRGLLKILWWFWRKPTRLRSVLTHNFSWEF
jgi:glycosyltransferase involved in cell wall biosynthesis